MILTLELDPETHARLTRRAEQEGRSEDALALQLLADGLARETEQPEEGLRHGTMADLFAGRTGVVSGSGEAYSENGGKRFAEYIAQKHKDGGP